MIRTPILSISLLALPIFVGACISSEETGGANRASAPQPIFASIDTSHRAQQRPTPAVVDSTTKKLAAPAAAKKKVRTLPALRAKRDTVVASLAKRAKSSSPSAPSDTTRPTSGGYTIQLGAYKSSGNAFRAQHAIGEHYRDHDVFSKFDSLKNVYRVSIGQFATMKEAEAFRRQMLKEHPKEYSQSWVNYLK